MPLVKKTKPQPFTEYNCLLREVRPGEFFIVSFHRVSPADGGATTPRLRTKEVLHRKANAQDRWPDSHPNSPENRARDFEQGVW